MADLMDTQERVAGGVDGEEAPDSDSGSQLMNSCTTVGDTKVEQATEHRQLQSAAHPEEKEFKNEPQTTRALSPEDNWATGLSRDEHQQLVQPLSLGNIYSKPQTFDSSDKLFSAFYACIPSAISNEVESVQLVLWSTNAGGRKSPMNKVEMYKNGPNHCLWAAKLYHPDIPITEYNFEIKFKPSWFGKSHTNTFRLPFDGEGYDVYFYFGVDLVSEHLLELFSWSTDSLKSRKCDQLLDGLGVFANFVFSRLPTQQAHYGTSLRALVRQFGTVREKYPVNTLETVTKLASEAPVLRTFAVLWFECSKEETSFKIDTSGILESLDEIMLVPIEQQLQSVLTNGIISIAVQNIRSGGLNWLNAIAAIDDESCNRLIRDISRMNVTQLPTEQAFTEKIEAMMICMSRLSVTHGNMRLRLLEVLLKLGKIESSCGLLLKILNADDEPTILLFKDAVQFMVLQYSTKFDECLSLREFCVYHKMNVPSSSLSEPAQFADIVAARNQVLEHSMNFLAQDAIRKLERRIRSSSPNDAVSRCLGMKLLRKDEANRLCFQALSYGRDLDDPIVLDLIFASIVFNQLQGVENKLVSQYFRTKINQPESTTLFEVCKLLTQILQSCERANVVGLHAIDAASNHMKAMKGHSFLPHVEQSSILLATLSDDYRTRVIEVCVVRFKEKLNDLLPVKQPSEIFKVFNAAFGSTSHHRVSCTFAHEALSSFLNVAFEQWETNQVTRSQVLQNHELWKFVLPCYKEHISVPHCCHVARVELSDLLKVIRTERITLAAADSLIQEFSLDLRTVLQNCANACRAVDDFANLEQIPRRYHQRVSRLELLLRVYCVEPSIQTDDPPVLEQKECSKDHSDGSDFDGMVHTRGESKEQCETLSSVIQHHFEALQIVKQRSPQLQLCSLDDAALWGDLARLEQIAESVEEWNESVCFRNVWMACWWPGDNLQRGYARHELSQTCKVVFRDAQGRLRKAVSKIVDGQIGQTSVAFVQEILGSASTHELTSEFKLLARLNPSLEDLDKSEILEIARCLNEAVSKVRGCNDLLKALEVVAQRKGIECLAGDCTLNALQQLAELGTMDLKACNWSCGFLLQVMHNYETEISKLGEFFCTILELRTCSELLDLLALLVDEEQINLMDAVEEFGESVVQADVVSAFDKIRPLMQQLARKTSVNTSAFDICVDMAKVWSLSSSCESPQQLAATLRCCSLQSHGLMDVYQMMSNRSELTRNIINECVSAGTIRFFKQGCIDEFSHASYSMLLTHASPQSSFEANVREHSQQQIEDLYHRALLVAESRNAEDSSDIGQSKIFIDTVESSFQVLTALETLAELGSLYEKHELFDKAVPFALNDVSRLRELLEDDLQCWRSILHDARRDFPSLNLLFSKQLHMQWEVISGAANTTKFSQAVHMLNLILPPLSSSSNLNDRFHLRAVKAITSARDRLFEIGRCLQLIFSQRQEQELGEDGHVKYYEHPVSIVMLESCEVTLSDAVLRFCAHYNSTPLRRQVLICSSCTTVEEIRAFTARATLLQELCLIWRPEALNEAVRAHLSQRLMQLHDEDPTMWAIVVFTQRSANCTISAHLPKRELPVVQSRVMMKRLKKMLQLRSLRVVLVTSDRAGMGKTSAILADAERRNLEVTTLTLHGNANRRFAMSRLTHSDVDSGSRALDPQSRALHIDIASQSFDTYQDLDTILFELILLNCICDGAHAYQLQASTIYCEVANSSARPFYELSGIFFQRTDATKHDRWFERVHLQSTMHSLTQNLRISSDVSSDIQVVCAYLASLDNGTLGTQNLVFSPENGEVNIQPLSRQQCADLLTTHFFHPYQSKFNDLPSFNVLKVFLAVLAQQLRKLASSPFFRTELSEPDILQTCPLIVRNMTESCMSFTARSLRQTRARQALMLEEESDVMLDIMQGLLNWDEADHYIAVMHAEGSSMTVFYQQVSQVPADVRTALENQRHKFEDFFCMNSERLFEELRKVCSTDYQSTDDGYILTPDNLLKMVLILVRVQAMQPVVLIGEAGCGKTSLIKELARRSGVVLEVLNIHAGRSAEDICEFVHRATRCAEESDCPVWMFFDEINTCAHLGLIKNIVCDRKINGVALHPRLVTLAACNPYRRKPKESLLAGFDSSQVRKPDHLSKLVYRVHPLPLTMLDLAWDYGTLTIEDEKRYISKVLGSCGLSPYFHRLFTQAVSSSQVWIRKTLGEVSSASMRDVQRCRLLYNFFHEHDLGVKYSQTSRIIRSIVLAISHCYRCRLPTPKLRSEYDEYVTKVLQERAGTIRKVLREEQNLYLEKMEIEAGIARNEALRENVFIILVCILLRLPVFLVGKPGCSKSLAVQIIASNLRGRDSRNDAFKKYPEVKLFSFQGSQSSTSEGIQKVFDKAKKYRASRVDNSCIPVVLLDEIGLAEISPENPCKVLHAELEPSTADGQLDIAVVGISNWSLDSAKMSRAIHISRPDPGYEELRSTAVEIIQSFCPSPDRQLISTIERICEAYLNYLNSLTGNKADFHGLRDFYSTMKTIGQLAARKMIDDEQIALALLRNFGGNEPTDEGLPISWMTFKDITPGLLDALRRRSSPLEMIRENIVDTAARHSLVISNEAFGTDVVTELFLKANKRVRVMVGSRFAADNTEHYRYRMLKQIILCMENGTSLILYGLDDVYGSLYDMLNQKYVIIGGKKTCRVALGAYSHPVCTVHDDFKCCVVVIQGTESYLDPPFLNRFEKQFLDVEDIVNKEQALIVAELKQWRATLFTGAHDESCFNYCLAAQILADPMLCAVVRCADFRCSKDVVLRNCKLELVKSMSPVFVVRTRNTEYARLFPGEHSDLMQEFFNDDRLCGLRSFLERLKQTDRGYSCNLIVTFSAYALPLSRVLDQISFRVYEHHLVTFQTMDSLHKAVSEFLSRDDGEKSVLLLRCDSFADGRRITLARLQVDTILNEHRRFVRQTQIHKHVILMVHVNALTSWRENSNDWSITRWYEWNLVLIENLLTTVDEWKWLRWHAIGGRDSDDEHFIQKFESKELSTSSVIQSCALRSFTHIKYHSYDSMYRAQRAKELANQLIQDDSLHHVVQQKLERELVSTGAVGGDISVPSDWLVRVAEDTALVDVTGSLVRAALESRKDRIRVPLAKLIYVMENDSAFDTSRSDKYAFLWEHWIQSIDLTGVASPDQKECYAIEPTVPHLKVPTSRRIFRLLQTLKPPDLSRQDLTCHTLHKRIVEEMRAMNQSFDPAIDEDIASDIVKIFSYTSLASHILTDDHTHRKRVELTLNVIRSLTGGRAAADTLVMVWKHGEALQSVWDLLSLAPADALVSQKFEPSHGDFSSILDQIVRFCVESLFRETVDKQWLMVGEKILHTLRHIELVTELRFKPVMLLALVVDFVRSIESACGVVGSTLISNVLRNVSEFELCMSTYTDFVNAYKSIVNQTNAKVDDILPSMAVEYYRITVGTSPPTPEMLHLLQKICRDIADLQDCAVQGRLAYQIASQLGVLLCRDNIDVVGETKGDENDEVLLHPVVDLLRGVPEFLCQISLNTEHSVDSRLQPLLCDALYTHHLKQWFENTDNVNIVLRNHLFVEVVRGLQTGIYGQGTLAEIFALAFVRAFATLCAEAICYLDSTRTRQTRGDLINLDYLQELDAALHILPNTDQMALSVPLLILKQLYRSKGDELGAFCRRFRKHNPDMCLWLDNQTWENTLSLRINPFKHCAGENGLTIGQTFMRACVIGEEIIVSPVERAETGARELAVVNTLTRICANRFAPARSLLNEISETPRVFAFLSSFVIHMVSCLPQLTGTAFGQYICAEALSTTFVVGAESNEFEYLRGIEAGVGTRYTCACGFAYFIGDCGRPMETRKCPRVNCPYNIGGADHTANPGQRLHANGPEDSRGYVFTQRYKERGTQRQLSAEVYRVLGVLVHACAAARVLHCRDEGSGPGFAVVDTECLRGYDGDHLRYVWTMLHAAWYALCRLVFGEAPDSENVMQARAGNEEALCAIVHLLIDNVALKGVSEAPTTSVARLEWERRFSDMQLTLQGADIGTVKEVFESVNEPAAAAHGYYAEQPIPTIIRQITETDGADQAASRVQRFLREIRSPGLWDLCRLFENADVRSKHPILGIFLDHRHKLDLLQHMLTIVAWTNTVREACDAHYTRREAQGITMMEVIDSTPHFYESCVRHMTAVFMGNEISMERASVVEKRDWLHSCFQRFRIALEAVLSSEWITQASEDGCHRGMLHECQVVSVEPVKESATLFVCMIGYKDHGLILSLVLQALARLQNEFLQAVLGSAAQQPPSEALALGDMLVDNNVSHATQTRIQQITSKAACTIQFCRGAPETLAAADAELWDLMKGFAYSQPRYGRGTEVAFDLDRIERNVIKEFIAGKSILLADMETIAEARFKHETFTDQVYLLLEMSNSIPQEALPNFEQVKTVLENPSLLLYEKVLPAVETLAWYLCRHSEAAYPNQKMLEYARIHVDRANIHVLEELGAVFENLELRHVEAFHDLVESLIAPRAMKHTYTQELTEEQLLQLNNYLDKVNDLPALANCLRRCIMRRLLPQTQRNAMPVEPEPLVYSLQPGLVRPSPSVADVLDDLPECIATCHALPAYRAITARIAKGRGELSLAHSSAHPAAAPRSRPRQRQARY